MRTGGDEIDDTKISSNTFLFSMRRKVEEWLNNTMQKQTNKSFNIARILEDVAYLFLMT